MQRLKSNSAAAVNRVRGGGDGVWQPDYHDHVLRDDENTIAIARYVIANPKRAGLVERVRGCSLWDAARV